MIFEIDKKSIGSKIKDLRVQKGLYQKDFGLILRLGKNPHAAQNVVSRIETGVQELSTAELINVAEFFGVSLDYLVKGAISESHAGDDTALIMNPRLFSLFPGLRSKMEILNKVAALEQDDSFVSDLCLPVWEKINQIVKKEKLSVAEFDKVATTDG